jgi:hypothetical protein
MTIFESIFNATNIYNTLFLNIKSVLIHPTLDELRSENKSLYEYWMEKNSYKTNRDKCDELFYQNKAIHYPEFSRILSLTYGVVEQSNGEPTRKFQRIVNENEYLVIAPLFDFLHQFDDVKSFPTLCGYNIISYDIPFLIKRFIYNIDSFENKKIPSILKNSLNSKTWESSVVDLIGIWKFNGNNVDNVSLDLVTNFLKLKKTVELLNPSELSKYYWDNIKEKPAEVLKTFDLQSATTVNLSFQFLNKMRSF